LATAGVIRSVVVVTILTVVLVLGLLLALPMTHMVVALAMVEKAVRAFRIVLIRRRPGSTDSRRTHLVLDIRVLTISAQALLTRSRLLV
jgi:hypothetical protein